MIVKIVYLLNLTILKEISLWKKIILMRIINKFLLRIINAWINSSFNVFIPAEKSKLLVGWWVYMFIYFYFVECWKRITILIISSPLINYNVISTFVTLRWILIFKTALALYLLLYIFKLYFFHLILIFTAY